LSQSTQHIRIHTQKTIVMEIVGLGYLVYWRDTLDTLQEEIMHVEHSNLCWGEDVQSATDASMDGRQ